MIEDEKAFLAVQKHVIVGETPVIPHVVEGVEDGDRRLQDHLGHTGVDKLELLELLHVHTESGVQGFVPIDGHAAPLGKPADEFHGERVQPVEPGLGLVLFDRIPNARSQSFKVLDAGELGDHARVMDRGGLQKAVRGCRASPPERGVAMRRAFDQIPQKPADDVIGLIIPKMPEPDRFRTVAADRWIVNV